MLLSPKIRMHRRLQTFGLNLLSQNALTISSKHTDLTISDSMVNTAGSFSLSSVMVDRRKVLTCFKQENDRSEEQSDTVKEAENNKEFLMVFRNPRPYMFPQSAANRQSAGKKLSSPEKLPTPEKLLPPEKMPPRLQPIQPHMGNPALATRPSTVKRS